MSPSVPTADTSKERALPPSFIALPAPFYSALNSPSPSPGGRPNDRTPDSPYLQFFTAPSSPYVEKDDNLQAPSQVFEKPAGQAPPQSGLASGPPSPPPIVPSLHATVSSSPMSPEVSAHAEYFPITDDLGLDDESLSALEKIYLFSRSTNVFHRVFVVHAMPAFLDQITPQEAVEYVLPLLSGLAMDDEEQVKEVLAQELVRIMWWFFLHCQVVSDTDELSIASTSSQAFLHAQAFTPILGTLLLSPSPAVGGAARDAVVTVLSRVFAFDSLPSTNSTPSLTDMTLRDLDVSLDDTTRFNPVERALIRDELIQRVVIGMGRLDQDTEDPLGSAASLPKISQESPSVEYPESYFSHRRSSPANSTPSSTSLSVSSSMSFLSPDTASDSFKSSENNTKDFLYSDSGAGQQPSIAVSAPQPLSQNRQDASLESATQLGEIEVDEASIGRLSSMSLMAAVAASGSLSEATKKTFVEEVVRVSQDPIYWVRKEASFALGALAKVVSDEVVTSSLLPVFEFLSSDEVPHVRHSALFALPGLLSHLPSLERRSLVLKQTVPMASDPSPLVRTGLLEALGEIIYSFRSDPDGPPAELVELFLGRDEGASASFSHASPLDDAANLRLSLHELLGGSSKPKQASEQSPIDAFFSDPSRPLICAFNLPAITLTLTQRRWPELRDLYIRIAGHTDVAVQTTLAASVGELAKLIGPSFAEQDLFPLWKNVVTSSVEDVQFKAIESAPLLAEVVSSRFKQDMIIALQGLRPSGALIRWRNREKLALALADLSSTVGPEELGLIEDICVDALRDNVFAVRQAAISSLPTVWTKSRDRRSLTTKVGTLLLSSTYRNRITFVACQEALLESYDSADLAQDESTWSALAPASQDVVVDVRIALARLVGRFYATLRPSGKAPRSLAEIIRILQQDSSTQVKEFIQGTVLGKPHVPPRSGDVTMATFSRPPP